MATLLTAAAGAARRAPGEEGGPQRAGEGGGAAAAQPQGPPGPGPYYGAQAPHGGGAYNPPQGGPPPMMNQGGYYGGPPPANYGQYGAYNNGQPMGGYGYPPPVGAGYGGPQGGFGGGGGWMGGHPGATHVDVNGGGGGGNPYEEDFSGKTMIDESSDVAIRHAFVSKVYAILSVQLLVTFGICSIFNLVPAVRNWAQTNAWIMIVGFIVALVPLFTLTCFPAIARKHPGNMVLLMVLSVGFGLTLGSACAVVDTFSFLVAVGMTTLVTVSLSLFACQTKIDFTGCGSFVLVTLIILMVFGIVAMFIRNRIVQLVYASLGALLFSFYLVYDTQQIVGGKHRKFQYSIDDYIFASLTLYMDIINLFMYILAILAASRNE